MSNNPMVDQVNGLLGDLLAGGGEVFLPEVGSLYSKRQGAKRLSKRMIQPPCRVVSFSSQQRGESFVDVIARAAECDTTEAQEIYGRWLHRVREEEVVTIEGVGILKFKNFTPNAAFDKRLNPQGHEPVRIKSAYRFDWALWVGIIAILVAIGFGGKEMLDLYAGEESDTEVVEKSESSLISDDQAPEMESIATGSVDSDAAASGISDSVTAVSGTSFETSASHSTAKKIEVAAQTPNGHIKETASAPASNNNQSAANSRQAESAAPQPSTTTSQGTANTPAPLVSGRRYVVLGVFSTAENAARAVADATTKEPSVRCGIYRFGAKFMVSPFEAPDAEACTLYIRSYGDRFPGLWTYTAR